MWQDNSSSTSNDFKAHPWPVLCFWPSFAWDLTHHSPIAVILTIMTSCANSPCTFPAVCPRLMMSAWWRQTGQFQLQRPVARCGAGQASPWAPVLGLWPLRAGGTAPTPGHKQFGVLKNWAKTNKLAILKFHYPPPTPKQVITMIIIIIIIIHNQHRHNHHY